jgi:hypothetical protein
MSSKKFVVITSIYVPSEAVKKFSTWSGWEVVVVGDRKTPPDWNCENVTYLSLEEQHRRFPEIAKSIRENTYTRKMIGYLYAITNGAEMIFDTDDDNLPYDAAQEIVERMVNPALHPEHQSLQDDSGWVNIYPEFGSQHSWPRGFPLPKIKTGSPKKVPANPSLVRSVVQFLADQDPDVDAVYRMVVGDEILFDKDVFYSLKPGTYSPFNSQATLWTKETFPLMFFPLEVPDRVTDILRGYCALACLWKMGHTLSFASPVVYQERNPHNLQNDFVQETMLYHHAEAWAIELQKIEGATAQALYMGALKKLHELNYLSELNLSAYRQFIEIINGAAAQK